MVAGVKPEDLFLDTLEDLRRRCDLRATEYEMVQVAGLVRRLLFDGSPLLVEANKEYRFKPVYEWSGVLVAVSVDVGLGTPCIAMHWLDPTLTEILVHARVSPAEVNTVPMSPRAGNLDAFRRHDAVVRGAQVVNIQEIVTHYANREGGVHYDSRPAKSALLSELLPEHDLAVCLTVLAIGRIVHKALEPLAARIALSRNPHPYGIRDDLIMPVMKSDGQGGYRRHAGG
jgi:hypothetical protein